MINRYKLTYKNKEIATNNFKDLAEKDAESFMQEPEVI